ncbi:MAG: ring-hydroxylating oxygenase subunit alpha [Thiotrichales bacterium]|nr:ring-hydroxylating oxygenase subunit alpha [Thiotrichales bacterium]
MAQPMETTSIAVGPDPATTSRLPARFYLDASILELEKRKVFANTWQLAGHAADLATPGCYQVANLLGDQLVLIRGDDGVIRGFHNICRHRGHELLKGAGCTRRITCPYHAWTYDLDGTLLHARNGEHVASFRPEDHALKPIRVEEFLGLVMFNLDLDAPAFQEQFAGLEDEVRQYVPRLDELVAVPSSARDATTLKCNWKVLLDNCIECYHCTPAHPAFVDLVDLETYRITCHEAHTTHAVESLNTDNAAYAYDPNDESRHAVFWHLWPNVTFGVFPGRPNFGAFAFDPIAPALTRTRGVSFRLPGPKTESELAREHYSSEVLWPEDLSLCESVQRGIASSAFEPGRFFVGDIADGESEIATHFFQRRVAVALAGA